VQLLELEVAPTTVVVVLVVIVVYMSISHLFCLEGSVIDMSTYR